MRIAMPCQAHIGDWARADQRNVNTFRAGYVDADPAIDIPGTTRTHASRGPKSFARIHVPMTSPAHPQ